MLSAMLNRPYKKALFMRLSGFSPQVEIPQGGRTEQAVITATFMLMGRLAKMDGRVTEEEIAYASNVMQQLGLGAEIRDQAIRSFEHGKHPDADVLHCFGLLAKAVGKRSALAKLFLQVQCRAAYLKGELRLKDKMLLRNVAELLGYDKAEFLSICSRCLREPGAATRAPPKSRGFLQNAYWVLQLEPGVADREIRRAYRRLMSRNHPDKLASDNLSHAALRQAQEKVMAIRTAYETVCGYRKIRV